MNKNRLSFKIALSGVTSSVCLFLLLISGLLPMMEYSVPALAGILLIVLVVELNRKWALLAYVAVSFLGFFIATQKQSALLFVLFVGYYPILKSVLEQIPAKVLQWAAKLAVFNAAAIAFYKIASYVLAGQDLLEGLERFGDYAEMVLLGMANVVFVIYDIALTQLISYYVHHLRKRFFRH